MNKEKSNDLPVPESWEQAADMAAEDFEKVVLVDPEASYGPMGDMKPMAYWAKEIRERTDIGCKQVDAYLQGLHFFNTIDDAMLAELLSQNPKAKKN